MRGVVPVYLHLTCQNGPRGARTSSPVPRAQDSGSPTDGWSRSGRNPLSPGVHARTLWYVARFDQER